MKIDINYIKKNIDLNKLVKKFDELERSYNEDIILFQILESCPDIIDKDGMEVEVRSLMSEDLLSKLSDLSRKGDLISTMSKNFELIEEIDFETNYATYFMQSYYSKINKSFYITLYSVRDYNDAHFIEFKTEKKNEVNKKLKSIKNHIISQGYHDVQQG
ncbi:hypothetical protein [Candidatus Pelagibacter sp.]|uniref:hypothetical protein n=1 Tax=Candidatus Pelagibacter sp. TaxID=2024849 RepID=UPI003F82E72B